MLPFVSVEVEVPREAHFQIGDKVVQLEVNLLYCDRLSLPDRLQRDPRLEPRLVPLPALAISCIHACESIQCPALA